MRRILEDVADSDEQEESSASGPSGPWLPVYLDGALLETLAETLDPSGVPGTRRVQVSESGRVVEGEGYAVRASGRIGTRLLGAQVGGDRTGRRENESGVDQTEEQEFIIREATLLWQAHSLLREEGHLKVIDRASIEDIEPGDWVQFRARSAGRSMMSLSRLFSRIMQLQSEQERERLDRLREGDVLLRGARALPAATRIGDLSLAEARQLFFSDLVASLAAGTDAEGLLGRAAIDGFSEELQRAGISDLTTGFLDPELADWTAVLTVRTSRHDQLASGVLHDSEFGVFGKVTLARHEGEPIRLVRRTMLDWMDPDSLESLSANIESDMGGEAISVDPPLIQVLPLALWV